MATLLEFTPQYYLSSYYDIIQQIKRKTNYGFRNTECKSKKYNLQMFSCELIHIFNTYLQQKSINTFQKFIPSFYYAQKMTILELIKICENFIKLWEIFMINNRDLQILIYLTSLKNDKKMIFFYFKLRKAIFKYLESSNNPKSCIILSNHYINIEKAYLLIKQIYLNQKAEEVSLSLTTNIQKYKQYVCKGQIHQMIKVDFFLDFMVQQYQIIIDKDIDKQQNYLIKDVEPYNEDNDIENMIMKEFAKQFNNHTEPNRIYEVIGKMDDRNEKNIRRIFYNIYTENKHLRKELNKQKDLKNQLKIKLNTTKEYFEELYQCFDQQNDRSKQTQEIYQKYQTLHNQANHKKYNSKQVKEEDERDRQKDYTSNLEFESPLKDKRTSSLSSDHEEEYYKEIEFLLKDKISTLLSDDEEEHHEETEFQRNQRKQLHHPSSNDEVELQSKIKLDHSFQSAPKSYSPSPIQKGSLKIQIPQSSNQNQPKQ